MAGQSTPQARVRDITDREVSEIAADTYVYAYPLVLMEVTRRTMTNCEAPDTKIGNRAPMNQFAHMRAFPDATFADVVRPNADTLYSPVFFDVSREPLVIDVPDSGGRYYLLPILDMWTDVFASPGARTTGTGPQTFAIVGPKWQGQLPPGVEELRSPTSNGWLIGRTQTNGKSDYESVHQFQAGLKAAPLSAWGKANTPPRGKVDPNVDTRPPVEQVQKMDAATFFGLFTELMKENPPHANDYPMRQRMKRIGMEAGKPFDLAKAAGVVKEALERAPEAGFQRILEVMERGGVKVNGWQLLTSPIGSYGTDYARRASIAYFGLGANLIEDAFYPSALTQADGKPLDGGARYSVHFDKNQIPPVNAFWSITMYDERQLFTANPIGRYAIGDRDPLHFNTDGSLDIYFQRESPGNALEPNWLPTPAKGPFTLTMRLYWPKQAAIDGNWCPPAIQRAA